MVTTSEPPVLKEKFEWFVLSKQRKLTVLGYWVGSLMPSFIVIVSALLIFRNAVVSSIASTPHPELVYAILGTFLLGVILASITLYRYTIEGNLVHRWNHALPKQKPILLSNLRWKTYLHPLFELMLGGRRVDANTRQAVIEQEIAAVNERFNDRLSLPNYLAGALVGLGLVGTFVGLLGTLEDLGKLFGALVDTGSASANPAEVFADMVRRLQDPMRGMGTAFVASLYGLLGSLVLGLQILAVGKIGHSLINQLHVLVRKDEMSVAEKESAHRKTFPALWIESASAKEVNAIHELKELMHAQIVQQQQDMDRFRSEVLGVIQSGQTLTEKIVSEISNASKEVAGQHAKSMKDLSTILRSHLEHNHQETQILRKEIFNVAANCQSVLDAVRDSMAADEKFRKTVPRTTYWQEAWQQVQAYLRRSKTDETLSELSQITKRQTRLLNDIHAQMKTLKRSDFIRTE